MNADVQLNGLEDEVRKFIVENFLFGKETALANDESLVDQGIIDSTGVLELVQFLEQRYDIDIADQDLVPENLDSINRLVVFVQQKLVRPFSNAASTRLAEQGNPR